VCWWPTGWGGRRGVLWDFRLVWHAAVTHMSEVD
jgi:hypothetical protein